ncbi:MULTISPECIES: putative nucleotidyltransferase substrate binding domain-containing protein [unclassified Variovorax]|uniref:putative nucleotidyltransferase substrate binding domain-containing protein n=1 Tax=unclassified Variovorax TaxID=663243 RepID=UPI003ECFE0A0
MTELRAVETQREMLSLLTARVGDAHVRKACYVDGGLDLVSVCRVLSQQGLRDALVRDGHRLGIFTTADLRDALLRPEAPAELAVREVARFGLVEIHPDADLFEALWLMARHRVHRLLVRDGDTVLGLLDQLDLVSFVANHSQIAALQIDEAANVAELAAAAARIDTMVSLLHEGGIKIERIARLVGELNARLFARLWSLLAPSDLVANSCLVVMGSEGRDEQIVKTDQDNALLLRDGFACPDLEAIAMQFNAALAELGYPPCAGQIMLTNPLWRQPLAGFKESLRDWVHGSDPEGPMRLAIFMDSKSVAGDAGLLQEARRHLERVLDSADVFLARFASAIDLFDHPTGWWRRLTARHDDETMDLKKLGTFPIVHGVRALALQRRLRVNGTAARLRLLVEQQQIESGLARDVLDALHYLMALRLTHQLRQKQAGQVPGNDVRLSELGALERDALRDALGIVRRFRGVLRQRFHLDAL